MLHNSKVLLLAALLFSSIANAQTISQPSGSGGGGSGTVTSVAVTTQNGVSAIVTNPTTTPNLAFTLMAITPSSINTIGQITSTLAIGTAPFVITSTTLVPNLYVQRSVLADSATTNANLTGPITSVGNATSIASQTGTGSTFVMSASPTGTGTWALPIVQATSLALNGATIGSNSVAGIGQFASFGATTTGPGFYSYLTGDTVARVRVGLDANDMPSLAFGPGGATTRDTFLMRIGAGIIQHGTTDVDTAPVAQTIRTQGTLAGGTSNVAGANWTFIASPGKGTGAGGSIIFQTAPAGSTGTAVNAPVTALTIDSTGRVTVVAGITNSGNGAASVSNSLWNGTVFTGGSTTTNFPAMFVQPSGTTAVTSWSTSGTGLGMNLASGFAGNFLDFHVAGGGSLFSVSSAGSVVASGSANFGSTIQAGSTSNFQWASRGQISSPATGAVQLGSTDAAVAVAQTLRVQSVVAGTAAANGANWTLIGSLPTGTGTSGDIIIQTGVKTGSGTTQGTPTTAITIKGETQEVRLPQIASDTALTDTTVCQDTTNHGLRSGSGALGVCLGTSGRQFKTAFAPMKAGIDDLMKIKLWNYRYKKGYGDNGARLQYGPTAQDVEAVLPDLAGHDLEGNTINYDWGAFIPIMMKAIQQQQTEIVELKKKLR